jgi:diguanylate cyclase (GGDEF)-like protein/PAS domain S-box-containing protein
MRLILSRLIGRLPVGRKLLLIYLLDLTAVIYVSGVLINEKYISIDFAHKEIAGNAYIAVVRDVMLELPVPRHGASSTDTPTVVLADAGRRLSAAEQAHGADMLSAEASAATVQALQRAAAQPLWTEASHAAVFEAGRRLITRLGNQSNLILDPDLNSYYTMSLLLLRFPELQELMLRSLQKAALWGDGTGADRQRLSSELLMLGGRVESVMKGVESDYAEAVAPGPESLRRALAPSRDRLLDAVRAFRASVEGLSASPPSPSASTAGIDQRHAAAVQALQFAWRASGEALDDLLRARIRHEMQRMALHLGTGVGLLMVLLGMVYFIARQISQPIERLAEVAGQVSRSGDYTVRAAHDSRDEIGQLVTAFNGMLGELDRDRAMREELAATSRVAEAQRALVEGFPIPLIVTSIPDHRVLHANAQARPWLDGVTVDPWAHWLEPAARARYFQRLADLGEVDSFEVRWQRRPVADGEGQAPRWALLSGRQMNFQGQAALLTAFTPINQIKRLEQRLQLWAKVFEASSESILILDMNRQVLTANQAFSRATGWDVGEVVGQSPEFLYSDRHDARFYEAMWQAAVIRGSWQGELWLKRKNGEAYPTWLVANVVRNPDGRITNLLAAAVDISEHKANEARIHHLAHHDVLTDLPNRSLCMERLRMAVDQAGRQGGHVAVVFLDLDRFKTINDSMGHHVGDALLRSVAKRLQQAVRAGDTVSRLGGDEFVVVLGNVASEVEIAHIVNDRMVPLIRQPHAVEGAELNVSCSAGIAVYPQDGRDVDHLMRHADAAMYQAKAAGRDLAMFFTPEFHAQAQERLEIENALRHAVARGEASLHYQPRVDAHSGAVVGVEALVRWHHPELGSVSPGRFIPIAEETGQIIALGGWILEQACRQHAAWRAEGLGEIPVSVNVSAIQLRDTAFPALLREALSTHGVEAAAVELELTETFLMENAAATIDSLAALKALGVTLAIDDFGTGYSSLNYLHQFPIDKLKIDQSFVRDMLDDPADLAITQAIIGLGHTLGLHVVAEGVELDAEAQLLRAAGCDELQGYLFARPMDAAAFGVWMRGQHLAVPTPPRRSPLPRRGPARAAAAPLAGIAERPA